MKNRKILKQMLTYPLKNKISYITSLILFAMQDFAFLGYLSFVQFYAVSIIEKNRTDEIFKIAMISILLYGVINIILCIGMLLIDFVGIRTENLLKSKLIKSILNKDSEAYDMGDVNSRLINDVGAVTSFTTYSIAALLTPIISMIGISVILFALNLNIGLLAMASMIIPLIYNTIVLPKIKKISKKIVVLNSDYMKKVSREIDAISTIKLFNLRDKQIESTKHIRNDLKNKKVLRGMINNLRTLISNVCNIVVVFMIMIYAVRLYNAGTISLAQILLIPQLLGGMLSGIESLCSFTLSMQQPIESAKRVFEVIEDNDTDLYDDTEKKVLGIIESGEKNVIEIDKLSFEYDNKKMIFKDFNMAIRDKEIACIKGDIGTGKSTLIKLILGFLRINNGDIKIYNQSKKDLTKEQWIRNFAFVEQEPKLFNLSIEENIMIGNSNLDNEKLKEVLSITGLDIMLEKLPGGIKTRVNSSGSSLSGGQKQLVCLARALYSDSPVVILDEFSSAMDSEVEGRALEALKYYKKDKTFIIISHRESCTKVADSIIEIPKIDDLKVTMAV